MLKMYDMMMIFFNSVKEDDLTKSLKRVGDEIEKLDGKVVKTDILGRKTFARPMNKCNSGQYVKMYLELSAAGIDPLLARLKLNSDIFRVQIVSGTGVEPVEEKIEEVESDAKSE